MKLANTKRINEKIMQIESIRQALLMLNGTVTNQIASSYIIPESLEAIKADAVKLRENMDKNNGKGYSVEQITMLLIVEAVAAQLMPGNPKIVDMYMNLIAPESKVFDINEFKNNPYIKNIAFHNQQLGDYDLCTQNMAPYELMIYNIPQSNTPFYISIPRIGCFSKEFSYPSIRQTSIKSTWMSVTPNEVYTVQSAVDNAKGKVLTLGCGMGYFAYMASLKEDVESITIVELEQDVIDLFEKHILPQFENKEKITVVKADAIEFMKNISDGEYDYCFADIWIGIEDMDVYFSVKEVSRHMRKTKIDYWIEESFALYLLSYIWMEVLKAFAKNNHIELPINEANLPEEELRKVNYIHRLMKNVEINKPEDMDYYFNPKNIIKLINKSKLIF